MGELGLEGPAGLAVLAGYVCCPRRMFAVLLAHPHASSPANPSSLPACTPRQVVMVLFNPEVCLNPLAPPEQLRQEDTPPVPQVRGGLGGGAHGWGAGHTAQRWGR